MLRRALLLVVALALVGALAFYILTMPVTIPASALPDLVPDIANGKTMFIAGGCAECHAVPLKGCDRNGFMSDRRSADVDDIGFIDELFQAVISTNTSLVRIRFCLLGVNCKYAFDLNVGVVDFFQTFKMKRRCETGADNAGANGFLFHLQFPFRKI